MKKKILIIGGVAAGASAAAKARRHSEDAEIKIFEKNDHIAYAACGIPFFISNDIKSKNSLLIVSPASFKDKYNVDVYVNHEVLEINRENKYISVKNLKENTEST